MTNDESNSIADKSSVTGGAIQGILIFFMSILAAIVYGVIHDQVTARICVEYFTIGHPPVFGTEDPTLLGLGWGILATWWAGAIIGVPVALAARVGKLPKRSAGSMVRPMGVLLACMAGAAITAGIVSFFIYRGGGGFRPEWVEREIPLEKQVGFMVDAWAHTTSYGAGFLGGIVLVIWVLVRRYRADVHQGLRNLRQTDEQLRDRVV